MLSVKGFAKSEAGEAADPCRRKQRISAGNIADSCGNHDPAPDSSFHLLSL